MNHPFRPLALAALLLVGGASLGSNAHAQQSAPLYLGVRTNLLSLATLSPSLGVDLQWGTRWQAGADIAFGLASTDAKGGTASYTNYSGVGVEARRYFKPKCGDATGVTHRGLYLGLGAQHMHFDYKKGKQPSDVGREGSLNVVGLIAGYTFQLPARLSIDVAAGAGYMHRYYNRYTWYAPAQQNRLLESCNENSVGITHAEVSLVYHFKLK